ncbi:MAG: SsrA-binding protein SmpB [Bryobacterales bacterium]|nr:SsrA-binding protein SmpB [Bryobacterales bacterium]
MADKPFQFKILSDNRQAGHNYFLMDRYEAGMALNGTEVKAAKDGKVQLKDAYASIIKNEAWLVNAHISQYSHGNRENHEPVRSRKLLLHRREIDKLLGETREKGLVLIPTKMYLKDGRIKCEIAVAKGKKLYDKRETERKRSAEDEARAAVRASKIKNAG